MSYIVDNDANQYTVVKSALTRAEEDAAIEKASDLQSSASEIDGSVNRTQSVMPKNLISNGRIMKDFTSLEGLTFSSGDEGKYSIVNDDFFGGNSYLELVETEVGTSSSVRFDVDFSPLSVEYISFYIWIDDVTNYSNISIQLDNQVGSSSYYFLAARNYLSVLPNQWNNVIVKLEDFSKIGTITEDDNIISIKFTSNGKSGKLNNHRFGGVVLNQKSRPAITFSFDDGYYSDYTVAYPILKEKGYSATSYIISDNVGGVYDAPRTTLEEYQEMIQNGWTVGLHGATSANWVSDSTIIEAEASIKACKKYLLDNNLITDGIYSVAYPHGEYTDEVITVLKRYGITNARTTDLLRNPSPVDDLMKLKLGIPLKPTLQQNIDALEDLIGYGGLINIYGHELPTDDNTKCSPAVFQEFIDYIDTHYKKYVTTIPQWCKDYETGTLV